MASSWKHSTARQIIHWLMHWDSSNSWETEWKTTLWTSMWQCLSVPGETALAWRLQQSSKVFKSTYLSMQKRYKLSRLQKWSLFLRVESRWSRKYSPLLALLPSGSQLRIRDGSEAGIFWGRRCSIKTILNDMSHSSLLSFTTNKHWISSNDWVTRNEASYLWTPF